MPNLDKATLDSLAQRMLNDYDAVNPGTIFAEGLRLELADAWRIQSAVAKLRQKRGESVVGYKIGCVCQENQKTMGLSHPVWGRLWSSEQHNDGSILNKLNFANVSLEAEFAITLKESIDPSKTEPKDLIKAVEAVYPVIELHNLVLRGNAPHGAELLANNAIHAGVVRGPAITNLNQEITTDLILLYDEKIVDSWNSLRWPDDLLSSVKWLAEQLYHSGQRLSKNTLILTGAFGPPIPLKTKSKAEVRSSAFGNASATFD